MNIKTLNNWEKKIMGLCLIVGLLVAYDAAFLRPAANRVKTIEMAIEGQRQRAEEALRHIREAKDLESEYDDYVRRFKQAGSEEQVMSSILNEIETAAGKLDVPISDLKPNRLKKEKWGNRFSVSLAINGSFIDIVQFLYVLQGKPHQFYIEELQLDKGSRQRSSLMKARLVLSKMFIP